MLEAVAARLAGRERERVARLVRMGYYTNASDFLRDAVRSKLGEFEFVFVRETSVEKVKGEVLQYVKEHPNVYADEVAVALRIDVETAVAAIELLIREKKVVA